MYKMFLFLSVLAASVFITTVEAKDNTAEELVTISTNVNSPMTGTEKKVRDAAVKVSGPNGGHGSGSLIAYKDIQLVLTADHVVDDEFIKVYKIEKFGVQKLAIIVYSDPDCDIAVLYLPEKFDNFKPMKFEPYDKILKVGEEVTFSGYPSNHQLMTIRGRVAGYENISPGGTQMVIHTYGWFGSSGSAVYTSKGKIAGILWGIDLEYPTGDLAQIVEDMMWVVPIKNLKIEKAIETVCDNFNTGLKACK